MPTVQPPPRAAEPEAAGLIGDQPAAFDKVTGLVCAGQRIVKLTGHAGSGKTVLLTRIALWADRLGFNVRVAAPTHKAVGVIAEKLRDHSERFGTDASHIEVRTIHSLLGLLLVPDWHNDTGGWILAAPDQTMRAKQTTARLLVIVDESSMIGETLSNHIERRQGIQWLFVGDLAQLPPVGEGISRMLDAPDASLRHVIRQKQESETLALATRIRKGDLSMVHVAGRDVVRVESVDELLEAAIVRFDSDEMRADPSHARILVFRNSRREAINQSVRQALVKSDLPFVKDEWLVLLDGFAPERSRLNLMAERARQFVKGESGYSSSWRRFFELKEELGDDIPMLHVSEEVRVLDAREGSASVNDVRFGTWQLHVLSRDDEVHELPVLKQESRDAFREAVAVEMLAAQNVRQQMNDLMASNNDGEYSDNFDEMLCEVEQELANLDVERKRRWARYFTLLSTFANVDHAFCMTVHKAQGSTFSHVFVDVPDLMMSGGMRQRLAYTAMTRPSQTLTFCQ